MTLDERNDEVNKALENRFSQLNAALEAHEAKLKAMMVPVDTWVLYRSDDEYDCGQVRAEHEFYIGMIKLRGAWRLCHAYYYECSQPPEGFDWKPLVESGVEDRINAAQHIGKLREAIVSKKEKLVPNVEKAIATLAMSLERYEEDQR
jgi:hypothetical protein